MGGSQAGTLGYGIVGASKFAEFCLDQFRRVEKVRPVGVWSRTDARARAFADKHGIRHYAELDELIADPQVELVHVATIPAVHGEQALAAIECGKHVLCEKPLATTLDEARLLVEVAGETERTLLVNFVMRYGPLWGPVKTIIDENILGGLLRGQLFNCAGDSGLTENHWFWDKSLSGGIFVEHGVHFFDLLRSWLGEGRVVDAHESFRGTTGRVDQVRCDVKFGDETTVGFYHGFHQAGRLDRQELKLIFERGELVLRGWIAGEVALHAVLDDMQVQRIKEILPRTDDIIEDRLDGEQTVCIRRGREEPVNAEIRLYWRAPDDKQVLYGRAVQRLMEDLIESVRNRKHRPRLKAEDGLAALKMAVDAERLT